MGLWYILGMRHWVIERSIQHHTNKERRKRGLKPLKGHKPLIRAARDHSRWMARTRRYSHTGIGGTNPHQRATKSGFVGTATGENIWNTRGRSGKAWRSRFRWRGDWQLGKAAVISWLNSPGHRQNLLSPQWNCSGMGVGINRRRRIYLTQVFGKATFFEQNVFGHRFFRWVLGLTLFLAFSFVVSVLCSKSN